MALWQFQFDQACSSPGVLSGRPHFHQELVACEALCAALLDPFHIALEPALPHATFFADPRLADGKHIGFALLVSNDTKSSPPKRPVYKAQRAALVNFASILIDAKLSILLNLT